MRERERTTGVVVLEQRGWIRIFHFARAYCYFNPFISSPFPRGPHFDDCSYGFFRFRIESAVLFGGDPLCHLPPNFLGYLICALENPSLFFCSYDLNQSIVMIK
ncbi:hypothetical protein CDAR_304181 [Caerostris darwini]|uniref:Uncharacterized protein n=1 Tax=Caerostris darwini TaxID=1538125 RepID=A0AAV4WCJ5_9ARAC|nr:hypothetical protein CDAR_304181 [Caerostris darwini]